MCNECVLVLVRTAAGEEGWSKESSATKKSLQQPTTTIYVQLLLQLSRNTHRPVNWYTCICQIKNIHLSFTADLLPYIHGIYQKDPRIQKCNLFVIQFYWIAKSKFKANSLFESVGITLYRVDMNINKKSKSKTID